MIRNANSLEYTYEQFTPEGEIIKMMEKKSGQLFDSIYNGVLMLFEYISNFVRLKKSADLNFIGGYPTFRSVHTYYYNEFVKVETNKSQRKERIYINSGLFACPRIQKLWYM